MKNNTLVVILGIVLAVVLAGVGIVLFSRNKEETAPAVVSGSVPRDCYKIPAGYAEWTNTFMGTDWGAYGSAVQQYLGINPDDEEGRQIVDGFFKAVNVEPTSAAVKNFRVEIKKYLSSNIAQRHWQMPGKGFARC